MSLILSDSSSALDLQEQGHTVLNSLCVWPDCLQVWPQGGSGENLKIPPISSWPGTPGAVLRTRPHHQCVHELLRSLAGERAQKESKRAASPRTLPWRALSQPIDRLLEHQLCGRSRGELMSPNTSLASLAGSLSAQRLPSHTPRKESVIFRVCLTQDVTLHNKISAILPVKSLSTKGAFAQTKEQIFYLIN